MDINDILNVTLDANKPPQMRYTLWKFYDKDNKLLYTTKNVNQATLKHKEWWYKVVRCEIKHFATAGEVEDAKVVAIDNENSKHNVYGRFEQP